MTPELAAALAARDIDAVVDILADRLSLPRAFEEPADLEESA